MITCDLEQLKQSDQERLRAWLGMGEAKLLLNVISSQVKKHQVGALNDALESSTGNLKLESANAGLVHAQRYNHALEVINEIMNTNEPYETAKLL